MIKHSEITDSQLAVLIRSQKIRLAGNIRLKIYGLLTCKSGMRMKRENRVFFTDKEDAIKEGFRPCKNCLRK